MSGSLRELGLDLVAEGNWERALAVFAEAVHPSPRGPPRPPVPQPAASASWVRPSVPSPCCTPVPGAAAP